MAEETVVPQSPPGDPPYVDRVYSALKDNLTGFNKTPEQFKSSMQDSAYAAKAYTALKDNLTGFDKSENDFYSQVGLKKKVQPAALPSGSNLFQNGSAGFLSSQAPTELTPVVPEQREAVKKASAGHNETVARAQTLGQMNKDARAANPQPESEKTGRTWVDDVSQAAYLPAFNQGFNDLVVKPLAGATDFIDRSIDKVYTGITGEQTPEWLRKKGGFHKISEFYDKAYQERDKPNNIVSETAEGIVGTLPLMASLATGQGEANILSKTPQFASKLTKLLAGTKAATAYKDATAEGKGYSESLAAGGEGAVKGGIEGLTLEAQMIVGGALGKKTVNELAKRGLLKGGKAAEAVLHALSVGTVFGGTSAGEDLINGRDVDTHEAMKQFGMGLAFELPGIAKGINADVKNTLDGKKINSAVLQNAAVSDAASNLHAESVLRTLVTTPKDQLLAINGNIPDRHETLYANSIEQGAKAYETKDAGEKKSFYTNQLALKTQGDVKYIAERLAKDPQQFVEEINSSEEITPEQKIELVDKIISLRTQQVDLSPKTEKAPDAIITPERTKAAKEPVEAPLYTPEEIKAQNAETDAKIIEFQQKFPEAQIDPLEDLPEQVVRTFDRVENDVPTDPVAINDASDWLYNKYKQLSAMKQSDTRRLTIDQIEGMQEQLEADITLLENHKLKYHGEETGTETPTAEAKPAEQVVGSANESAPSNGQQEVKLDEPSATSTETPADVQGQPAEPVSEKTDSKAVAETPVEEVKPDPIRQKAIDAITHGIIGNGERRPSDPSPRFDLDMPTADQKRAIRDITNGNYESVVAKRMIDKVSQFEKDDLYPIIEGNGGGKVGLSRNRSATAKEIQENLDDAKQYKSQKLSEKRAAEFNKYADLEHGITEADFDNYEKYRNDPTGERASVERDAANAKGEVQRPRNDKQASKPQDTGSKTVQGSEAKAGDPLRSFADTIRKGKISKLGGFKAGTGFDVVWDGSLEVVASTIEGGAKIADAIEAGLKHVKATDWYKNLSNKSDFDKQYRDHLESEYGQVEELMNETSVKNATIESERQERGLPEVERLAKRDFPAVYEKAKQAILKNEIDPRSLAEYISKHPRSLTPEETVILALDRMKISNEHADVVSSLKDAYETGDMDSVGALEYRINQLEKQKEYNDEASVRAGYEQALGLSVRRLIIKEDYTYLNKLNEAKVANEGKDIPKDVREKIEQLTNRLQESLKSQEELESKLAQIEAEKSIKREVGQVKQRASKPKGTLKEDLGSILDDFKKEFKAAGKKSILRSDVPYREEVYAASKFMLRASKRLIQEGVTDLKEITSRIKELFADEIDLSDQDITDVFAGRYKDGPRAKSEAEIKFKANNEKLKRQIDGEIYKLRQQNRTTLERNIDYINAYRRAAILSRISTLFKLGAAATERLITTPIEEGIGSAIRNIPGLSKIASNAPREGLGLSAKAEAAAFADTFSKNVLNDVMETIKHGHGSLDYAYGKRMPIQSGGFEGIMEFPGKLHGAIKVIPKRNEFFRSFEKRVAFAEKQGLDVSNPLIIETIQAEAYKDAQRSIFMNDNLLTDKYREVINSLENSKNPNTRSRDRIAAGIMKYLLPIVKVPTNFALETSNYAIGSLRALPHIIKAATKGAESLTPEQADFVLRALKKNSIGLAFLALGYYNPNSIGGYYQQREKRKDNEAQVGDVNVFGVHLPHFLLHAPVLEVLQIGATLRRVKDKYERKHHGKSGAWAGTVAAAGGIASDIPFFDTPSRIGDALKSEKAAEYYLGEQVKSLIVPGLIQEGAELGDKKIKNKSEHDSMGYILAKPQKRKMDGILEHVQSGIPGARNMLPRK